MNAQTRELLVWLEREPRTYGEAVDVWRTSCPRLSIWEDALAEQLIEVERGVSGASVIVSRRGREALAER